MSACLFEMAKYLTISAPLLLAPSLVSAFSLNMSYLSTVVAFYPVFLLILCVIFISVLVLDHQLSFSVYALADIFPLEHTFPLYLQMSVH